MCSNRNKTMIVFHYYKGTFKVDVVKASFPSPHSVYMTHRKIINGDPFVFILFDYCLLIENYFTMRSKKFHIQCIEDIINVDDVSSLLNKDLEYICTTTCKLCYPIVWDQLIQGELSYESLPIPMNYNESIYLQYCLLKNPNYPPICTKSYIDSIHHLYQRTTSAVTLISLMINNYKKEVKEFVESYKGVDDINDIRAFRIANLDELPIPSKDICIYLHGIKDNAFFQYLTTTWSLMGNYKLPDLKYSKDNIIKFELEEEEIIVEVYRELSFKKGWVSEKEFRTWPTNFSSSYSNSKEVYKAYDIDSVPSRRYT